MQHIHIVNSKRSSTQAPNMRCFAIQLIGSAISKTKFNTSAKYKRCSAMQHIENAK